MHPGHVGLQLLIADLPTAPDPGPVVVVGRWGDRQPVLGQHRADRLDAPDQAVGFAVALMGADELHNQWEGRSSSAAKKVEAALRMALARFSSAFSRRSRLSSADSSVVVPGRRPPSTSDWRTHLRTVSAVPTPSSRATSPIAAHSESCWPVISLTILTARSRSSGGYLFDVLPAMTPTFPTIGVSGHAGAVHDYRHPSGRILTKDRERLLFRIAQECLTNAVRHSGAQQITIRVTEDDGALILDVIDNGHGFDAEKLVNQPKERHFGLRLMADATREGDAELSVASAPGAGTHWRLRTPAGNRPNATRR